MSLFIIVQYIYYNYKLYKSNSTYSVSLPALQLFGFTTKFTRLNENSCLKIESQRTDMDTQKKRNEHPNTQTNDNNDGKTLHHTLARGAPDTGMSTRRVSHCASDVQPSHRHARVNRYTPTATHSLSVSPPLNQPATSLPAALNQSTTSLQPAQNQPRTSPEPAQNQS